MKTLRSWIIGRPEGSLTPSDHRNDLESSHSFPPPPPSPSPRLADIILFDSKSVERAASGKHGQTHCKLPPPRDKHPRDY